MFFGPTQVELKSDVETWASANRVSVGNLLSGKTEDFLREVGYRYACCCCCCFDSGYRVDVGVGYRTALCSFVHFSVI